MQFTYLKTENFGSIGSLELDLQGQGLTVITGRNEDAGKADSNGAGKSLLLEAICWCLWGKTIRGLSGDDVVNRQAGKDCYARVAAVEDDYVYIFVRTRKMSTGKPNDLRVYRRPLTSVGLVEEEITASSIAQTQELINSLLGLDFTTFCVMMPGAGVRASEMTDKEVKTLLEKLLQTEVLGDAHKHCRDELKTRQTRQAIVSTEKKATQEAIDSCEVRMGSLKEHWETFEDNKEAQSAIMQTEASSLLSRLETQDKVLKKTTNLPAQLEEAEGKYATQKAILQEEENAYIARRAKRRRELETLHRSTAMALAARRELGQHLLEVAVNKACSTCQQLVTESHHAAFKTSLQEQGDLIALQLDDIEEESNALEGLMASSKARFEAFVEKIQPICALYQADIARVNQYHYEADKAQALKDTLMLQMKDLGARQWTLQQQQNPFQGMIAKTAEEAFNQATKSADLLKELNTLDHEIALYDYWLTGFSPKGIRSFLLEHVTPVLNEAVKKYADLLTDGEMSVTFHTQQKLRSGKMVEKFNIVVSNKHGGPSYEACSAGERSRANLCVAYALGDLAAMRASKSVSFRFLDEPFENVDESGTDAIMTLLNDQKDRFDSVFVITHQDHFKQLFPRKITIVKKNGISYMEDIDG